MTKIKALFLMRCAYNKALFQEYSEFWCHLYQIHFTWFKESVSWGNTKIFPDSISWVTTDYANELFKLIRANNTPVRPHTGSQHTCMHCYSTDVVLLQLVWTASKYLTYHYAQVVIYIGDACVCRYSMYDQCNRPTHVNYWLMHSP